MKALVYTGPKNMAIQEVSDPIPVPDEVLIKISAVGICGSDVHAYLGHDERRPAPLILGHEAVGTVVSGIDKGKRVAINPLVTCGQCEYCSEGRTNLCQKRQIISMPPREGAFAEFLRMPVKNLQEIPSDFPVEKAALTEPLACSWHAINLAEKHSFRTLSTSRVIVLGGGAIGLGAALILAARGAKEILIAETNKLRREILKKLGPFQVYNPLSDDVPEGGSANIIIDAFGGNISRKAASKLISPGGVIIHIGLADSKDGLDIRRITLQEITLIGTYTYTVEDFKATLNAIISGKLGNLDWIETRPLDNGPEAFTNIIAGQVAASKVVLLP